MAGVTVNNTYGFTAREIKQWISNYNNDFIPSWFQGSLLQYISFPLSAFVSIKVGQFRLEQCFPFLLKIVLSITYGIGLIEQYFPYLLI
jgi:hypothetical protein